MRDDDEMFARLQAELPDFGPAEVDGVFDDDEDDGDEDDREWTVHLFGGRRVRGPFLDVDTDGCPLLEVYRCTRITDTSGRRTWSIDKGWGCEYIRGDATRRDLLQLVGPGQWRVLLRDPETGRMQPGAQAGVKLRGPARTAAPAAAAAVPGREATDERLAWYQREIERVRELAAADVVRAREDAAAEVRRVREMSELDVKRAREDATSQLERARREHDERVQRLAEEVTASRATARDLRAKLEQARDEVRELDRKVQHLEIQAMKVEARGGATPPPDTVAVIREQLAKRAELDALVEQMVSMKQPTPDIREHVARKIAEVREMGGANSPLSAFMAVAGAATGGG